MFDNILALNLNKLEGNFLYAQSMISLEKEEMIFLNPIECNDKVEVWMLNIEKEMKYSNRSITKEAIFYYRFKQNRLEWMRKYIGMVVLAVNQVWSTWEIEEYVKNIIK
jgi:dynein heavy chain